jgi:CBS-domain-containing membrane protein
MLDDLLARDFMIPIEEYPHIAASSSICDAMQLMHSSLAAPRKYRTILVTNESQHMLGYLSLHDLIRAVGPRYLRKEAPDYKGHQPFQGISNDLSALSLIWQEGFSVKIREEAKKPVKEMMTLIERTVSPEDPFAKCVYLMLVQDELMIPVVEKDKVVGVIRQVDIFELIAENLCAQKHQAS